MTYLAVGEPQQKFENLFGIALAKFLPTQLLKNAWSVGLISMSGVYRDRLAICLFATLFVWH
jgi:hypothetical protein